MKNMRIMLLASVLFLQASFTHAADLTLRVVDRQPPKELGESIRNILQAKAIQLLDGDKPVYQVWFRSEVPLKSKPASPEKVLSAIAETTLIGAIAVGDNERDYKDNEIPAGVYTMRFALQPQDGDHLGTADYPYFAVLVTTENDPDLDAISKFKPLVKASGKSTASGHPVVLSLRPVTPDSGNLPRLDKPAEEHDAVRVKVPAAANGEKISLMFDLVYKGHGHIQ